MNSVSITGKEFCTNVILKLNDIMKIFYLTPSIDCKSGYTQYSYDIISNILSVAQPFVLCNKITQVNYDFCQVPVLRDPNEYFHRPFFAFMDARKVVRQIQENTKEDEPTYIHATAEGYALLFPFIKKSLGKQILTVHGTYSVFPLFRYRTRYLYKWAIRKVDRIISVSHYTKRHLLSHATFLSNNKVMVFNNGVNFKKFPIKNTKNKTRGPWKILTVGAVKRRKGIIHLVKVVERLVNKLEMEVECIIVGKYDENSSYFKELKQHIADFGLEVIIRFTGEIEERELDEQYKQADLFVLMSVNEGKRFEGYGLVFHEAAMRGLPSIGTVNCGAEDAISQGVSGLLVVPYQHDQAAQVISRVLCGKLQIEPYECQQWARVNDWGQKDLLQMYRHIPSIS